MLNIFYANSVLTQFGLGRIQNKIDVNQWPMIATPVLMYRINQPEHETGPSGWCGIGFIVLLLRSRYSPVGRVSLAPGFFCPPLNVQRHVGRPGVGRYVHAIDLSGN